MTGVFINRGMWTHTQGADWSDAAKSQGSARSWEGAWEGAHDGHYCASQTAGDECFGGAFRGSTALQTLAPTSGLWSTERTDSAVSLPLPPVCGSVSWGPQESTAPFDLCDTQENWGGGVSLGSRNPEPPPPTMIHFTDSKP